LRAVTVPTHRRLFVGLLFAVGLTHFPALSLGPLPKGSRSLLNKRLDWDGRWRDDRGRAGDFPP
jgi:hypothetical protein